MVITRFAPSPTGYLHIGGARTALFNWLWARKNAGKFILRIEDTDLRRNTPTAMQQVIDDLRWLGLNWDEGPDVGGPSGPYLQSQRLDLYRMYAKKLIEEGKAYYCFDTPEELETMRQKASAEKSNIVYQRPKQFPDESDVKKAQAAGKPVTIRFAMPAEEIVITDYLRGEVRFNGAELGDWIIIKSDGFPTYNFAVVVDDALMKVNWVIRGQEHLMNTPGQQELWKALGFGQLPQYVHMSVTISEGGGKLSKRERPASLRRAIKKTEGGTIERIAAAGKISIEELKSFLEGKTMPDMPAVDAMAKYLGVELPEINVVDFFRSGYIPETMVNFLALLGWNPGTGQEIMTVEQLVAGFDISRLTKSNSLFDRQKLLAFNTEHLRMTPREKTVKYFRDFLNENQSPVAKADDKMLGKLLELCSGARTLADVEKKSRFLFVDDEKIEYDEKAVKKVLQADGLSFLRIISERLAAMESVSEQAIEQMLRGIAEEKGVGLGKVAQPLRVALCGSTVSLSMFESVAMLGKKRTLARIETALKKFGAGKEEEAI
jgi:glutamyl/glutaminyl-tRNA synthetase